MGKTQIIIEALELSEATLDAEARTVKQRIIKPGRSANGRVYDPAVLTKAAPLFENVKTFADHPGASERRDRPERSVRQITGWLDGVELREDGIYAVRHFTSNQAGADTYALVRDIVEGRAPASLLGGSINAVGVARKDDAGDLIIESIEAVHSVDDVTTPAAGGGFLPLLASAGDDLTGQLLGALSYDEFVAARPEFVERLRKEWQTVRQTEAVAAAHQERDQARGELVEAHARVAQQAEQAALQEAELAKLRAENARKVQEVELERAFRKAALPTKLEEELRKEIADADPSKWEDIVQRGTRLMAVAGEAKPAPVTGAPRLVTESAGTPAPTKPGPVDMDKVNSLHDFYAQVAQRQPGA